MTFAGKNLRYLRRLRGWTQEEFANKLKIKRSLIGAYEEERAEPRIEVLEVIGQLFKLSLDELLLKDLGDSKNNFLAKRRASKLAANSADIQFTWLVMPIRNLLMN
jgi:transcriptional regulator with XRE-family HTH domain